MNNRPTYIIYYGGDYIVDSILRKLITLCGIRQYIELHKAQNGLATMGLEVNYNFSVNLVMRIGSSS